jgi:S1-C subfamily serine protease
VELDKPERAVELPRRSPTRTGLAVLAGFIIAVAAVAVGFAHLRSHSTANGTGTGVVVIETNLGYQGGQAAGTGIVLTSSGEVLTNNHVIRGATDIRIRVPSTGRSYSARVVGYSVSDDVAVLQASDASNLKTTPIGDSDSVDAGEAVRALGNAGGTGRLISASGTITGLGRSISVNDEQGGSENLSGLIETNAAVRPGDSGGPLLNASGEVIGMDTAASVSNDVAYSTTNQGFAIPINKAVSIVKQIESGDGSEAVHIGGTAFLGVESTTNQYDGSGAVISAVVPGGAAEAAGLSAGDLIVSVDGRTISSPDDLSGIVTTRKPGDSIAAVYVDQYGTTQTANVTLASGPPR